LPGVNVFAGGPGSIAWPLGSDARQRSMSTTFDVYPRTKQLPSFAAIIDASTRELHRFLESINIRARPLVHLRIQRCEDDSHVPFSLDDPARWEKDTYAWFMVGETPGGTDAYFNDDQAGIQERWDDGFDDPRRKRLEPLIRECIATGRRWWFRRSAGQPAIINVAYGLLAASLAAITDGFVTSDDSAWDWQRLPALPDEFFSWYFRPEKAIGENFREWSQRCLNSLPGELEGPASECGAAPRAGR
jgi:hypothetical protein